MADQTVDPDPLENTPIAELFARNPGGLDERDIVAIIDKLRSQRHRFVQGDKSAGKVKPTKVSENEAKATAVTGSLDLDDLGL